jgi:hypothetical protein
VLSDVRLVVREPLIEYHGDDTATCPGDRSIYCLGCRIDDILSPSRLLTFPYLSVEVEPLVKYGYLEADFGDQSLGTIWRALKTIVVTVDVEASVECWDSSTVCLIPWQRGRCWCRKDQVIHSRQVGLG